MRLKDKIMPYAAQFLILTKKGRKYTIDWLIENYNPTSRAEVIDDAQLLHRLRIIRGNDEYFYFINNARINRKIYPNTSLFKKIYPDGRKYKKKILV